MDITMFLYGKETLTFGQSLFVMDLPFHGTIFNHIIITPRGHLPDCSVLVAASVFAAVNNQCGNHKCPKAVIVITHVKTTS